MPYRVLVFEDRTEVRSIIAEQLSTRLSPPKSPVMGGSLPHVWSGRNIDFLIASVDEADLKTLVAARSRKAKFESAIMRVLEKHGGPDLVILDLALDDTETNDLEENGGTDTKGRSHAETALPRTTGFRILQYLVGRTDPESPIPLITTLASNPRVTKSLLDAGAFSVVLKPETSSVMPFHWDLAHNQSVRRLRGVTAQLRKGAEQAAPHISSYLARLANEVQKAVRESALRRSCGHAPSPVPFWAAHDKSLLGASAICDTNLLLMDVRGFSKLVALGVDKPPAVFDLMNIIWDVVLTILDKYDAEVNNFIGDAALVFLGVYQKTGPKQPAAIGKTIACAKELCDAFALDGLVRKRLAAGIQTLYGGILRAHDNTEAMIEHVNGSTLGLRIVIADPDEQEALYGAVGNLNRRWQHTILSRFMNALARAESAVGKWEKEGVFKDSAVAHSFLLWDKKRATPSLAGTTFEDAESFLGRKREEIRDVPEGLEIFRVNWADPVTVRGGAGAGRSTRRRRSEAK